MSGIFSKPSKPKPHHFAQPAPIEEIAVVEEEAEEARRRERKRLLSRRGHQATRLFGIQSAIQAAIKKRLGA